MTTQADPRGSAERSRTELNRLIEIATASATAAGMLGLATAVLPSSSGGTVAIGVVASAAGAAIGAFAASPRRRRR